RTAHLCSGLPRISRTFDFQSRARAVSQVRARPRGGPQSLYIAHRRFTEDTLVLPVEVGGVVIPHAETSARCVEMLTEYQSAGFLEPRLFLKLQGAHCSDRLELSVEPRDAHAKLMRKALAAQRLVIVIS